MTPAAASAPASAALTAAWTWQCWWPSTRAAGRPTCSSNPRAARAPRPPPPPPPPRPRRTPRGSRIFRGSGGSGVAEPGALLVGVAAVEEERMAPPPRRAAAPLRRVEVEPGGGRGSCAARERCARLRRRAVHHHRRERDDARLHRVEDAEVALLGDAEVVGDDDELGKSALFLLILASGVTFFGRPGSLTPASPSSPPGSAPR